MYSFTLLLLASLAPVESFFKKKNKQWTLLTYLLSVRDLKGQRSPQDSAGVLDKKFVRVQRGRTEGDLFAHPPSVKGISCITFSLKCLETIPFHQDVAGKLTGFLIPPF